MTTIEGWNAAILLLPHESHMVEKSGRVSIRLKGGAWIGIDGNPHGPDLPDIVYLHYAVASTVLPQDTRDMTFKAATIIEALAEAYQYYLDNQS